ncbi:MAG: hypothetical protein NWE98_10035 [Candidatus Bathyarchaeota archaeon]|nr:hypothetical protein [Candidatus Bathyarchaeota archaeon]
MYELEITLVGVTITIIILVLLSRSIKKVNQYEKGIVERFNAYKETVEPGYA